MGVRHAFVSGKPDGADDSLIRPSNWNEDHAVDLDAADVGAAPAVHEHAEYAHAHPYAADDHDHAAEYAPLVHEHEGVPAHEHPELAAPLRGYASGAWYEETGRIGDATTTINNGILAAIPHDLEGAVALDALAWRSTGSSTDFAFRIGVYADAAGLPGALLREVAGTVSTPSVATTHVVALDPVLELPRGRVWVAFARQSVGAPTVKCVAGASGAASRGARVDPGVLGTWTLPAHQVTRSGVFGALPDPMNDGSLNLRPTTFCPIVLWRAA